MTIALNEIDKLKVATDFNELAEHTKKQTKGVLMIIFNDGSRIELFKDTAYASSKDYSELQEVNIKNLQHGF